MATSASESYPELDKNLLQGLQLTGYEDADVRRLMEAVHVLKRGGIQTLSPLLPILLNLKGEPFTLQKHAPFEAFYRTRSPRRSLFKTARQVGKSVTLAARGIVHSNCVPYFSTLYIAPLFETIRRFSQNYMRPFIETSPINKLFVGTNTVNSVLQRTFLNHSQMIFSFAYLDAERTRGIACDKTSYDEIQTIDSAFIPIIRETMSGSKYKGIEEFAGTPLGLENCIEGLWQDSSQAEWVIKCTHCSYYNIPALAYDLDKMTGPLRDNISKDNPATSCAKCGKVIYPQLGRWVHAHPEKRWSFVGRHIPQCIMPMHYGDYEKWDALLGKREGRGNTPVNVYYNEVCGESYDTGSRLITLTEIKRACVLPWTNTLAAATAAVNLDDYIYRVLACDWGGGGADGVSYTTYAILGMLPDGKIDVIFGYRSLDPHEHVKEARLAIGLMNQFKCHVMAHDYTGAGSIRETVIVQAGYSIEKVLPIAYTRFGITSKIMQFQPSSKANPRSHYRVDKTRSLLLTCNQIKSQWIRFFQYDYGDVDNKGVLHDFLALVDEKQDSRLGKDIYTIIRDPSMSDDFAQSVNIGACALWNMTDRWPNIAEINNIWVPQDLLNAIHPSSKEPIQELW